MADNLHYDTMRPPLRTQKLRLRKKGIIVNWEEVEDRWMQTKESVRRQWGKLTDDDLERIAGKRDVLVTRLQSHYGLTKQEAQKRVDEWVKLVHEPEESKGQAGNP